MSSHILRIYLSFYLSKPTINNTTLRIISAYVPTQLAKSKIYVTHEISNIPFLLCTFYLPNCNLVYRPVLSPKRITRHQHQYNHQNVWEYNSSRLDISFWIIKYKTLKYQKAVIGLQLLSLEIRLFFHTSKGIFLTEFFWDTHRNFLLVNSILSRQLKII